jgi:hypothetical protein
MKTIEDISSCKFFSSDGVTKASYHGYDGWLPNTRTKPKEGYNKVSCKYYMREEGKCRLQDFMPTPWIVEHNPCVFAED